MEKEKQIIETLRSQFHQHRKTWHIKKKTNNGSGGWASYDGKEFASFDECNRVIDMLCDTQPNRYKRG
jgi:hypothetical protein